jgi:mannose-6-phosphate isomerase-like protein (cupin superfamily)
MLTKTLSAGYDYLAPDGSEIRLLAESGAGGLSHCTLPPGNISSAVKHRSVQEIWYVMAGKGEVWRNDGHEDLVTPVEPGVSLLIEPGTRFQFRCLGSQPLEILIATMPKWPGPQEAVAETGYW